jgi:hypothetical protein
MLLKEKRLMILWVLFTTGDTSSKNIDWKTVDLRIFTICLKDISQLVMQKTKGRCIVDSWKLEFMMVSR